jgi:hypothetical protein
MPAELLIDNWTVMNWGELLHKGLQGGSTRDLSLSPDGCSIESKLRSVDSLRIESALQVLQAICFNERLFVDAAYISTWAEFDSARVFLRENIIVPQPFRNSESHWLPLKEEMAAKLCPHEPLRTMHKAGEEITPETDQALMDPFVSQVLWGGAAMLARASYFSLPYAPHPAREKFFFRDLHLVEARSANHIFQNFLASQRFNLFKRLNLDGVHARFRLPPVAATIIQQASSIDDLPVVAMQVREDYAELRKWLGEFQEALNIEDVDELAEKKAVLNDIAGYLNSLASTNSSGETGVEFGLDWSPSITLHPARILKGLRNRIGIRAQIGRLVLNQGGQNSVERLLSFLHENHSERGRKALQDLTVYTHSP